MVTASFNLLAPTLSQLVKQLSQKIETRKPVMVNYTLYREKMVEAIFVLQVQCHEKLLLMPTLNFMNNCFYSQEDLYKRSNKLKLNVKSIKT